MTALLAQRCTFDSMEGRLTSAAHNRRQRGSLNTCHTRVLLSDSHSVSDLITYCVGERERERAQAIYIPIERAADIYRQYDLARDEKEVNSLYCGWNWTSPLMKNEKLIAPAL